MKTKHFINFPKSFEIILIYVAIATSKTPARNIKIFFSINTNGNAHEVNIKFNNATNEEKQNGP